MKMTQQQINTIKEQVQGIIMYITNKPSHERETSSFLYENIYNTIVKCHNLTEESDRNQVAEIVNDYLI